MYEQRNDDRRRFIFPKGVKNATVVSSALNFPLAATYQAAVRAIPRLGANAVSGAPADLSGRPTRAGTTGRR